MVSDIVPNRQGVSNPSWHLRCRFEAGQARGPVWMPHHCEQRLCLNSKLVILVGRQLTLIGQATFVIGVRLQ